VILPGDWTSLLTDAAATKTARRLVAARHGRAGAALLRPGERALTTQRITEHGRATRPPPVPPPAPPPEPPSPPPRPTAHATPAPRTNALAPAARVPPTGIRAVVSGCHSPSETAGQTAQPRRRPRYRRNCVSLSRRTEIMARNGNSVDTTKRFGGLCAA
jgi:hypothetical protein